MVQPIEHWKPVVGYEARYEVSDLGRIRNVDYIDSVGRRRVARLKNLTRDTSGHLQVALTLNGRKRMGLVHTLVLEAFVGPRPVGMLGLHWDDDPTNNRLTNLRWGTAEDNQRDAIRNGRNHALNREYCPRGHALATPNLTNRHAEMGKRGCWSCDRERSEARQQRRAFDKEKADRWFERLSAGYAPVPMAERSDCPRGHALEGDNLRRAQFEKRGQRSCRACAVEMSAAKRQGRAFSIENADSLAAQYLS